MLLTSLWRTHPADRGQHVFDACHHICGQRAQVGDTKTLGQLHLGSSRDDVINDLAWTCGDPFPDNSELTGLICFFNESADLEVDGEEMARLRTLWSVDLVF